MACWKWELAQCLPTSPYLIIILTTSEAMPHPTPTQPSLADITTCSPHSLFLFSMFLSIYPPAGNGLDGVETGNCPPFREISGTAGGLT
jgi:hypothetical protein